MKSTKVLKMKLLDGSDQELQNTDISMFSKVSDYNDYVVEDISNDKRYIISRDWSFDELELVLNS